MFSDSDNEEGQERSVSREEYEALRERYKALQKKQTSCSSLLTLLS